MSEIPSIGRLRDKAKASEKATRQMQATCLLAESLLRRAERLQTPPAELLLRVASLYALAIGADPSAVRPYLGLARLECLWGSEARALMLLNQARKLNPRHADVLKMWHLVKKQLNSADQATALEAAQTQAKSRGLGSFLKNTFLPGEDA